MVQIEKAEEILIKNLEVLIPGQKKQILKAMEEYANHISSQLEPLVIKKNADGLLPCPFCGEYPKIGSLGGDNENWAIWCECQIPCAETGLSGETKEEIINAWNKRK